jgi:hypothetical protein
MTLPPAGTCVTSEHHLGVYESLEFSLWYYHCVLFFLGRTVYWYTGILRVLVFTVGNGNSGFSSFSFFGKRKIITIDNGTRIQEQMPIFHLFSFLITTFHIQVSRLKC